MQEKNQYDHFPDHKEIDESDSEFFQNDGLPYPANDQAGTLDDYFSENSPRRRGSSFLTRVVGLSAIAITVGIFALLHQTPQEHAKQDINDLDVIKADSTPVKLVPEDRGGLQVPNTDKTVYEAISSSTRTAPPTVERLLPPPEEPIDRTKPEASKPSVTATAQKVEITSSESAKTIKPVEMTSETAMSAQENNTTSTPSRLPTKPLTAEDITRVDPTKTLNTEQPTPQATGGLYHVQLGAFKTPEEAQTSWKKIKEKFPRQLGVLESKIERKDLGEKGIFYRLQTGPFDNATKAKQLCTELTQLKQGCFFVDLH